MPSVWPADLAEEKGALGVCLLGQAIEAVRFLAVDDFSLSSHREIFATILELVGRGELALEISLVAGELRKRGSLEQVGGVAYLADLDYGVVPERGMRSRVKILRELADRRWLLRTAKEIERRALDLTSVPSETFTWLREISECKK